MTEPEPDPPGKQHKWLDALEARKERYQDRGRLYRIGWVITGSLITLAGVVMLLAPGPAFVVIPIGLAMLALEFAWAEAALEKAVRQAEKAQAAAKEADTKQKIASAVATVLIIAAVVAGIFYWDINLPVLNPD
jgi:uncharacterized protein (TIGR02611 family)